MKQLLQFNGPGGPISISHDRNEFIKRILMEKCKDDARQIVIAKRYDGDVASSNFDSYVPLHDFTITRETLDLKSIQFYPNKEKQLQIAIQKAIDDQLNIMLIQKQPDFFVKDLNLDTLYKMSYKYSEKGYSEAFGLHVHLSKYQNFFSIVNPRDFKFFYSSPQALLNRDAYVLKHRLVNLKQDNWILCKYDNNIIETEMLISQMYAVSGINDIKLGAINNSKIKKG